MSKFSDMLSQARRGQSGGTIGFFGGKSRPAVKPRAAALLIEFPAVDTGQAEAAIKAGANGLLFHWSGSTLEGASLATLKQLSETIQSQDENAALGLRLLGDGAGIERKTLEDLKEHGVHFLIVPLQAPARLLNVHLKDFDIAVTLPWRSNDPLYPLVIRNLGAFEGVSALHLDGRELLLERLSIEEALGYRAMREALRLPALLSLTALQSEAAAYGLLALGVQAIIVPAAESAAATMQRIQEQREWLEKVHRPEEKELPPPTVPQPPLSTSFEEEEP
uniref:Uncharacterized protein n=1 Tax=Thermogemmatispora argillosa TaxID=2045280 RepID=A0A455T2N5_9CHLR|nr:hypothetical protein KTA_30820 [Thermogemmatispora argillosa]